MPIFFITTKKNKMFMKVVRGHSHSRAKEMDLGCDWESWGVIEKVEMDGWFRESVMEGIV